METQTPAPTASAKPTPKLYFYKEIVSNHFLVNGKAVQFEILDGNRGVLALTPGADDPLIAALNDAANRGKGGIVKISEAQYSDKKKRHPFVTTSARKRTDMLQIMQSAAAPMFRRKPEGPGAPVAAGNAAAPKLPSPPAPATTPQKEFRPAVARQSDRVPPAKPAAHPA